MRTEGQHYNRAADQEGLSCSSRRSRRGVTACAIHDARFV